MSVEHTATKNSAALIDAGITPDKKTFLQSLTEDWWAVILGSIIIASVLFLTNNGTTIALPVYKWSGSEELLSKILAPGNLLLILKLE